MKGKGLFGTIPLGMGRRAWEVIYTLPVFCTKKQKNQPKHNKNLPGYCLAFLFFLSHPAQCEQRVSSVQGVLNAGNEPSRLMGIFSIKHTSHSLVVITHKAYINCIDLFDVCMQTVWCVCPPLLLPSVGTPPGPICVSFTAQVPFYCHPSQ